jgi:hypothetical protein
VAFRVDAQHVLVPLRIVDDMTLRPPTDAASSAKGVVTPMAKFGFPFFALPATAEALRPGDVQTGDRWLIHLGPHRQVAAEIEAIVAGNLGCSDAVGALLRVAPADARVLAVATAKYVVAVPDRDGTSAARAAPVGVAAPRPRPLTDGQRALVESRLATVLERELPGVQAEAADDVARMATSEIPRSRAWAARVRALDAGLARHAATLSYDAQAFQLAPDEPLTWFVRATWLVDGRQAFAAAVWLRGATLDILQSSVRPAGWLRTWEFQGRIEREHLGLVLNTVDVDGDGRAEVLFAQGGYEGMSLDLLELTPTGLQSTGASWTYGC